MLLIPFWLAGAGLGILAGYFLAVPVLAVIAIVGAVVVWKMLIGVGPTKGSSGALGAGLLIGIPAALFMLAMAVTAIVVRVSGHMPDLSGIGRWFLR